jgi:hypothetical protein
MLRWRLALVCLAAVLLPATARAQASISGTVIDASGAVLPGVTIEVASAALIERVRTAVSDGAGAYRITALRPGTYTVTFIIPGFNTNKREGIILQGTFDAKVDAEMKVGALEETITVSGAAPIVDVQNTIKQTVLTKEQIGALPGARTVQGRAALIPGVVIPGGNTGVVAHGSDSQDSHTMVDGFKSGMHLVGRGTGRLGVGSVTQTQEAAIEELVYSTDSQGAEYALSGVRMNMIPKEGSNKLAAEVIAYGSNKRFESNNLGGLQDIGFRFAPQQFFFDYNPVIGGPIRQNKLWYFGSVSGNKSNTQILDTYFKPGHPGTPEGCRNRSANDLCPADTGGVLNWSETVRITHQVSQRHKLRYSFDNTRSLGIRGNYSTGGVRTSPEASWRLPLYPAWLAQVKYTAPLTNRLFLEGGISYERGDFRVLFQPENAPNDIAKLDIGRGFLEENHNLNYSNTEKKKSARISLSYITGSHSLKTGFEDRWATALQSNPYNADILRRRTVDGVPLDVSVTNGPSKNLMEINFDGGAYVQDQWRVKRLTINIGARFDHFGASVPPQVNPASFFTPEIRMTGPIENTPNWTDWATRTGFAWDVFGNGKTALKTFAGKFVAGHALSRTSQFNPIFSQTDIRSWTDRNGDGTVVSMIDGRATPQFDEIGPPTNARFGTLDGIDKMDPNLKRDKNWTYELTADHELFPRVRVGGGYYRRRYYDLAFTDNLATSPANQAGTPGSDWIPFTFIGPRDSRLTNGGGEAITLYNLDASKLGLRQGWLTNSGEFRVYNGIEFSANIQLPRQGFAMTSFTTNKTRTNSCNGAQENPNDLRFCDQSTPFRHIFKVSGGVPLKFKVMISGNFQIFDAPGAGLVVVAPYFAANMPVNTAAAGRTVTGGQATPGTINVNLLQPNTIYQQYFKLADVRFSKVMNMGPYRLTALAEFENLFNIRSVNQVNQAYAGNGATWLRPTSVQRGRNIRFGLQFRF